MAHSGASLCAQPPVTICPSISLPAGLARESGAPCTVSSWDSLALPLHVPHM